MLRGTPVTSSRARAPRPRRQPGPRCPAGRRTGRAGDLVVFHPRETQVTPLPETQAVLPGVPHRAGGGRGSGWPHGGAGPRRPGCASRSWRPRTTSEAPWAPAVGARAELRCGVVRDPLHGAMPS
ncbi:hypothetical protein QJS66_22300 [Kocuria rhizophila]|nr:hypothetical protein QJS66_22300 [Kocuria rhizophila]